MGLETLHILAATLLAFAQESTYDHDVLRTKTGDTLRAGTGRTTFEAEYYRDVDGAGTLIAPRVLAQYGFSDWAQAGIQFDMRSIDGDGDFPSSGWDAGDPYFTARLMPWESESWLFGTDVAFKLPSARNDEGVGTDEGDAAIRGIMHRRFDDWRFTVNLGMGFQGDNGKLAQVDAYFLWGVAGEYVVSEQFRVMAELTGTFGHEVSRNLVGGEFGRGQFRGRVGFIFAPEYDWTIGASVEGGINPQTPDYDFLLSISKLWGAREDGRAEEPPHKSRPLDPASRPAWLQTLNPLDTDVAQTIPEGQGTWFMFFGPREQADDTTLWTAPRVGAVFGVGTDADVMVSVDHRILSGGSTAPKFSSTSGMGDMNLRLRFVPLEYDYFRGGLSLGGKIPLRDDSGVSTGEIDVTLKILMSFLFDDWRLHVNGGMTVEGDPTATDSQNDYLIWSVAAEVPLCDCATILAEVSGSDSSAVIPNLGFGTQGSNVIEGRLGFLGPIDDGWSWTVAGSKGFTDDSPDWQVEFGIGHLFGE